MKPDGLALRKLIDFEKKENKNKKSQCNRIDNNVWNWTVIVCINYEFDEWNKNKISDFSCGSGRLGVGIANGTIYS